MRYAITHKTFYRYDNVVSVSHHLVRLTPRDLAHQRSLAQKLTSEPTPAVVDPHPDYFGNIVNFITIEGPHRQLAVCSECEVEVRSRPSVSEALTSPWEEVRDLCQGNTYNAAAEACEYAFASPLIPLRPEFARYALPSFQAGRPILEGAVDLMERLHGEYEFDPHATTVATPLEQVFHQRRGVCQDFAQLQIAFLRAIGLPARYVSGYLETVPPPGQAKLVGADASHAWVQLWCGPVGWIDLDPTNNLLPSERHITLAWGRDFGDVSPLRGVLVGSGSHKLSVSVDVSPLG